MKTITKNKQGFFNYQILETFEAGLALTGPEVKSAKQGQIHLKGSYATITPEGEVWLINCWISPYRPAENVQTDYRPDQPRKLLLHKNQINSLAGKLGQKGLTIIPLSVYTKKGLIKVALGLVKGKTGPDKRREIKQRQVDREIRQSLKQKKVKGMF